MKILLANHRPRVRFALRILLEQQTNWTVIAEARDAAELLEQVRACLPDLVLLDGGLPGLDYDRHPAGWRAACPDLRVIVLGEGLMASAEDEARWVDAFASKAYPPELLLATIRECLNGHGEELQR